MENNDEFIKLQSKRRFNLSKIIIFSSLGLLVIVSIFALFWGDDKISPETIFTAVIGLVGTWVGTILAFYFSKDNFEAASKATQDLVSQITGEQKLKSIPVEDAMISMDKAHFYKLAGQEDALTLNALIAEFKTFNRLPILNQDLNPLYIIHKSVITRFISDVALGNLSQFNKGDVETLTLKDFNSIPENLLQIQKGFITVRIKTNLSQVKAEMGQVKETLCSDVFITEDGSRTGKVIGWLTNQIITEKSVV